MAAAWPIVLSYIPIGLACGVLSVKVGIGPLWALLMSMTIMSGGAQFMIANLWLAGLPTLAIVASVCAISLRFALYSASLTAVAGVAVALAATRGEAQARMAGPQDADALRGDAQRGGDAA